MKLARQAVLAAGLLLSGCVDETYKFAGYWESEDVFVVTVRWTIVPEGTAIDCGEIDAVGCTYWQYDPCEIAAPNPLEFTNTDPAKANTLMRVLGHEFLHCVFQAYH